LAYFSLTKKISGNKKTARVKLEQLVIKKLIIMTMSALLGLTTLMQIYKKFLVTNKFFC